MTTTFSDSALVAHSAALKELKKAVLEPALTAAAALFWVAALPFVAFSLGFVKVWDTLTATGWRLRARRTPLILRRSLAKNPLTLRARREATKI